MTIDEIRLMINLGADPRYDTDALFVLSCHSNNNVDVLLFLIIAALGKPSIDILIDYGVSLDLIAKNFVKHCFWRMDKNSAKIGSNGNGY